MEKEDLSQSQAEAAGTPPAEDITIDLETTHEITRQASLVLEVSKELTSSSKALLEEIEPIV